MNRSASLALIVSLLLAACGGGGGASDPGPDTAAPGAPVDAEPVGTAPPESRAEVQPEIPSKAEAARFLTQATFGPTLADIDALHALGNADAWLEAQRHEPVSLELPQLIEKWQRGVPVRSDDRLEAWWKNVLTGPDQLRQRMAFALSEILVVSDREDILSQHPEAMAAYYDLLSEHALGNYRDLLEAVTLSPAMGHYLSLFRNGKSTATSPVHVDENYAREVMQLFTVGLVALGADGTPRLDSRGQTIPTFTQDDVENLARAFTGWAWTEGAFWDNSAPGWMQPLQPDERYHDTGAKIIIGGIAVPAGLGARAELDVVLDALFTHPNVGPFIGRQLIQRLVTSNPSPGYVARVARVFEDNGQGVRGDLYAVTRAILLDAEARTGQLTAPQTAGKLREPLLRVTALWRAFNARSGDGRFLYANPERAFGQAPLRSPSVFNFFRPDYAPPGALAAADLVAPELKLADDSTLNLSVNTLTLMSYWYQYEGGATIDDPRYFLADYRDWQGLADRPDALLDRLDLLLMSGQMPAPMRQQLLEHLQQSAWVYPAQPVAETVMLIVTSPQFALQR